MFQKLLDELMCRALGHREAITGFLHSTSSDSFVMLQKKCFRCGVTSWMPNRLEYTDDGEADEYDVRCN